MIATRILSSVISIWFVVWAIRRKGDLDYNLSPGGMLIRWFLVVSCLGGVLVAPQLFEPPNLRLGVFALGMAFLVWPNFAYHLVNLLSRRRSGKSENDGMPPRFI
jgi:hypothetical protein